MPPEHHDRRPRRTLASTGLLLLAVTGSFLPQADARPRFRARAGPAARAVSAAGTAAVAGLDGPPTTFTIRPTAAGPLPTAQYFAGNVTLPVTAATRTGLVNLTHGPYTGPAPTVVGALTPSAGVLSTGVRGAPAPPSATRYPSDGRLHNPEPQPYMPAGGAGTNGTWPVYRPRSDFDYESLTLALYQEWIELDLFRYGLKRFSVEDFEREGLHAEDRTLIEFMSDQEIGHSTMLSNILGPSAAQQCNYNYPFRNVIEFVDFSQKLTRFGESGVYGFLPHLDSRESAQLLLQSITTEARQQMVFRQFQGLFPMPVWFEVAIPQSWAWTLIAPYIASCPANQTRLAWQNFPALTIVNEPNSLVSNVSVQLGNSTAPISSGTNVLNASLIPHQLSCRNSSCTPAVTHNRSVPLSWAGKPLILQWEAPGKAVGPNNSYVTATTAGAPRYVAWVTQLNITYSPLYVTSGNETILQNSSIPAPPAKRDIETHALLKRAAAVAGATTNQTVFTGATFQPNVSTYAGDPAANGTMFIAITDDNPYLTPFNISMINPHVVAGPAMYQAG